MNLLPDSQSGGRRVLHLISSSGVFGAENVLLELAAQTQQAGWRVAVGVFRNSRNPNVAVAELARERGLEVRILPCEGRFDKRALRSIRDYVKTAEVAIVHSHNYKSNFYSRFARDGRHIRWLVTNHGRRIGPLLVLYNSLDALVVSCADKVVAVSETIAKHLRYSGVSARRLSVIYNGIDLARFSGKPRSRSFRECLGIGDDSEVIGTVGALTEEKGHKYLVGGARAVFRHFPNATFLIVGDGPERGALEATVREAGLEKKVIFTGLRNDIPAVLSAFDVFVLPSLREGLPMALLEAAAARVPVVASAVGAVPKVIEHGKSGILVPPKRPELLAEGIIRILSDKEHAFELARGAYERVRQKFSSERMTDQYLCLYRELLSPEA